MPDEEFRARKLLLDLVEQLGSLETWLPEGSVSAPPSPIEASGTRVFVSQLSRRARRAPAIQGEWPLDTPLAGIGENAGAGFRCVAVSGADWTETASTDRARRRTSSRRGPAEVERYAVAFRPFLPDETGC